MQKHTWPRHATLCHITPGHVKWNALIMQTYLTLRGASERASGAGFHKAGARYATLYTDFGIIEMDSAVRRSNRQLTIEPRSNLLVPTVPRATAASNERGAGLLSGRHLVADSENIS